MTRRSGRKNFAGVLLLLITIAGGAAASDPADTYLNKAFWQKFDWDRAETSKLWKMQGWEPFTGEQSEDRTFVKKRKIVIAGLSFDANLAFVKTGLRNRHFTSIYGNVGKSDCEAFAQRLTDRFGPPTFNDGIIRLPLAEKTAMIMVNLQYQWLLGDTRVNASCFGTYAEIVGAVDDENKYVWSMKFAHRTLDPDLQPRFALACTRNMVFDNDGQTNPLDDMITWIDPNGGRALDLDFYPLSDEKSFKSSTDRIEFNVTTKTFVVIYKINRITGSLAGDVWEKGRRVAAIAGKCEKTDAPARKF